MDIDAPTAEQIEKAAAFFDAIKKAKEHGKDWWAHHEIANIERQIDQDKRIEILTDACERAEMWVSTFNEGKKMRDILREALTLTRRPDPQEAA
jgi:FAD/FMN-containing dehydrogenase